MNMKFKYRMQTINWSASRTTATNDGISEGKLQIDKLSWGVKRNKIAYLFDLLSHFLLTYQHVEFNTANSGVAVLRANMI